MTILASGLLFWTTMYISLHSGNIRVNAALFLVFYFSAVLQRGIEAPVNGCVTARCRRTLTTTL